MDDLALNAPFFIAIRKGDFIMGTIKSLTAGLYLAVASIALSATSAQAVLMDNGMITLDTDTNLERLDLTESTNRSYNDVAGQFGMGGDFAAWRHATAAELTTLFTNGGFPPPHFNSPATPQMLALINLLGVTLVTPGSISGQLTATVGFYNDDADGPHPGLIGLASLSHNDRTALLFAEDHDIAEASPDAVSPANPSQIFGHWLVRTVPIPEPSALILFGSSVVLLGAMRRRRKRAN